MQLKIECSGINNIITYYIPGSLSNLHISAANFILKELEFTWSPVALTCPIIHYNILASNCGSCPTVTNYTTITCTDIPTNGRTCEFAVQTVVCGNITGDIASISTDLLYPREDSGNSVTATTYTASIGFLATALIVGVVIFVTVIAILSTRNKAKIKALKLQLTNREESSTQVEATYEDVTGPLPSVSIINTQDNVAYGHTQTSMTHNIM